MTSKLAKNILKYKRFAKKYPFQSSVSSKTILEWLPICSIISNKPGLVYLEELVPTEQRLCLNTVANTITGDITLLDDETGDDLYDRVPHFAIIFSNEDDYNLIRLMYNI